MADLVQTWQRRSSGMVVSPSPADASTSPSGLKILIVTDAWIPQANGVVTTVRNLRRQLYRLGHRVVLLTPQRFATLPSFYPGVRLAWPQGTGRYIEQSRPDCILIMIEGPLGLAARDYCNQNAIPYVTCFTTRWAEYFQTHWKFPPIPWGYKYLQWFHDKAAATLVSTPSLLAELEGLGFQHLVQWSRGVDLSRFQPISKAQKQGFLPHLPRPLLLYVGRISKEKNLEAFLTADLPGSKLLVGHGPDFEELSRRYPEAHFAGLKQGAELSKYYACSDLLVFPSKTDTFGLVILEALASGLPVVAFDVTGPRDIFSQPGSQPARVSFLAHEDAELVPTINRALEAIQTGEVTSAACRTYALGFLWETVARDLALTLATRASIAPQVKSIG